MAEDHVLAKGSHEERRLQHYRAILIAVEAGNRLLELFNSGRIHDTVMHRLESELDQEDLFAARVVEVMDVD
ncbi:hypothetical protein [Bradyrhizobium sp. WSM3983]|uniref:hypothetical protein n=1 Tax=Bradyrhizobium sp. WSM3983 TaxID=1038867 RepID=UPI000416FCC6|nr:hypothetical protein [Bradyrhizobium sp. WSM3983]